MTVLTDCWEAMYAEFKLKYMYNWRLSGLGDTTGRSGIEYNEVETLVLF